MTDTEKLQDTADTLSTIKENIQTKYKTILGKIQEIRKDLDELDKKYPNNSEQFKEEMRKKLNDKIQKLENQLKEWVDKQSQKAQDWFDEQTDSIKKIIATKIKTMITALAGI